MRKNLETIVLARRQTLPPSLRVLDQKKERINYEHIQVMRSLMHAHMDPTWNKIPRRHRIWEQNHASCHLDFDWDHSAESRSLVNYTPAGVLNKGKKKLYSTILILSDLWVVQSNKSNETRVMLWVTLLGDFVLRLFDHSKVKKAPWNPKLWSSIF